MSSRPEVEWDDVEVGWMRALHEYRAEDLCPCGCGWPRTVSLDPMTEFRIEIPPPVRCHVRAALVKAQESYARQSGAVTEAALWTARLRSDAGADPHRDQH